MMMVAWGGGVGDGGIICIGDGVGVGGKGVVFKDDVKGGGVSGDCVGVGFGVSVGSSGGSVGSSGGSVTSKGGDPVVKIPVELQGLLVLVLIALTFQ